MPNALLESPLTVDRPIEAQPRPDYSREEETYLRGLRTRLASARDQRDQQHPELDGMSYAQHYELNERTANTYLKPKENKADTNYQSGTVRQKLFALLSALVNLDLHGDVSAFDAAGLEVQGLGDALEDVMLKTDELDRDDEKKYLRQYELLKHGTVFVEEVWDERMRKEKRYERFDGSLRHRDWRPRLVKAFARPSRNIVPGLNVYLGDLTKYDTSEQPYVFTVDAMPYEEARLVFGTWERWGSVPRKLAPLDAADPQSAFGVGVRFLEQQKDSVEVVRYQDRWNNEFAVLLNGILMTPVGLPLPWGYDDYNLAQQNLEPIHAKFAYGKSLVARIRAKVALLDEMERLAVLKTQRSFAPPSLNLSGRVLSSRVFMPGTLTHGVPKDSIVPISEKFTEGVTQAELSMIQEVKQSIDAETTSPTFSGQQTDKPTTATEIIELQRQAKQVLGLTVFAVSMLEWKLEWLRLRNLLAHWFQPEDQAVDEARGVLKARYRTASVERPVEGQGMGRRIVVPTEQVPGPEAIQAAEDALSEEQGVPVRLLFLDPQQVQSAKLVWQIVVRPKERKTSETEKLMFRAFMQDAQAFGPTLNVGELQQEFAAVWGKDPRKLFVQGQPQADPNQPPGQGGQPGQSSTLSPRVSLPSAEAATNRQTRTALGMTA